MATDGELAGLWKGDLIVLDYGSLPDNVTLIKRLPSLIIALKAVVGKRDKNQAKVKQQILVRK